MYTFRPSTDPHWDFDLLQNGVQVNRYAGGWNFMSALVDSLNGSGFGLGEVGEHYRAERRAEELREQALMK